MAHAIEPCKQPLGLTARFIRRLRRPIPELYAYLVGRLASLIWAGHLSQVGHHFFCARGARIMGANAVSIGDRFHAGPFLWIEAVHRYGGRSYTPSIRIGSNVTCSDFVHIAATTSVTVCDGVLIGSRVHITDHGHGTYSGPDQDTPDTLPASRSLSWGHPVVIGRNVWLGDGVVVLPGVTIGDGSIIGSNSVVTRNIPGSVIAVGAPAVVVKYYDGGSGRWLRTDP